MRRSIPKGGALSQSPDASGRAHGTCQQRNHPTVDGGCVTLLGWHPQRCPVDCARPRGEVGRGDEAPLLGGGAGVPPLLFCRGRVKARTREVPGDGEAVGPPSPNSHPTPAPPAIYATTATAAAYAATGAVVAAAAASGGGGVGRALWRPPPRRPSPRTVSWPPLPADDVDGADPPSSRPLSPIPRAASREIFTK